MRRRDVLQFISVIPILITIPVRYAWAQVMVWLDPVLSPVLAPPAWRRQGPPRARPTDASWAYLDDPAPGIVARVRSQPVPEDEINHDDDPRKEPPWHARLEPLGPAEAVADADWECW